jgi:dTDP-glucose 4,6-dehydratase
MWQKERFSTKGGNMKILVTGGAGFIGGNFVLYMVNKYPEDMIVNLDALTYAGNLETLKSVEHKPNYKFVKGDISDRTFINQLFDVEKFDWVVNFAAESHVDRSIVNPGIFVETNVLGTQVLLDASRKFDVKRYHQVSTDEVYGDLPLDRKDLFFTEDTPLHTSSPYSASKASADLLCLAYFRTFNSPITISRCSNNYGPYHFPEKLIPLMISRALNNQSLPVYGKGENVRDWLHVHDHCVAIDLILRNGRIGEVYNIGGHNERTNLEVVQTILHELNKPESLIQYVTDRKGHDLRYAIDPTKIETELGWKAEYTFDTGIKQTIEWYLNNKTWWENILSGEYKHYFEHQYTDLNK